ncbi:Gfo/Idh/MocA family oxidoreductase [Pasteurella canis]|uniref:Gfo/Idh/MocA family oxidoreductase n=1 Tax=Pasteurella canis TaxID=753 RepID=UPI000D93E014|nr:Gfo/Idh/MocA family oxidoreductase [Pasteurella canis]UAY78386.1 Gfo/Idh/MocA family oxidoreductase [Pasteurella canis]SPY33088.1 oxidoreductase YdgJ [Pasteurella canis]
MEKIINVGIAGFGMSAKTFHSPFLDLDPRFQIKKVFERTTMHSKTYYPYVEVVHDFELLLTPEIDLIIITTPNQTHYELAQKAILSGKHVVVEKPLAITAQEAKILDKLAHEKKVMLSVYQNRRWDSGALTVKKLIENHLLGDIVEYEIRYERFSPHKNKKVWKETGELGTGLVYDLGVHLIDHVVDLFGIPTALYADITKQNAESGSDDSFRITFYYTNKKVIMSSTKFAREQAPHIILQGKLGSYIKPKLDNQETLLIAGIKPEGNWNQELEQDWGILHTEINSSVIRKNIEGERGNYQAYYDNIYTTLTTNLSSLIVTAKQAYQVLFLIEKAYESAQKGQKIIINLN